MGKRFQNLLIPLSYADQEEWYG